MKRNHIENIWKENNILSGIGQTDFITWMEIVRVKNKQNIKGQREVGRICPSRYQVLL